MTTITTQSDNNGFITGRDIKDANLINTGDISGNNTKIIAATNVVLQEIQQARSAIAEMEAGIRLAEMQLADAVARKIQQLSHLVAQSTTYRPANPYKSLLDYKLQDAAYFYGRDEAIHALLDKIHNHSLTVLHAESGSGKSSLLQAGIGARVLAARHLPVHQQCNPRQQSVRSSSYFVLSSIISSRLSLPIAIHHALEQRTNPTPI